MAPNEVLLYMRLGMGIFSRSLIHTRTQILSLFHWKVTKHFPYSFLETYPNFPKFSRNFIKFSERVIKLLLKIC